MLALPVLAGSSTGTDQPIFSIVWDTWLNFRTGVVSGLNYTQLDDQAAVFSFDSQYDGQTVQGTNEADPTHYFPQKVRWVYCSMSSPMYTVYMYERSTGICAEVTNTAAGCEVKA